MNKNDIIRDIVLEWLDTEPDFITFIEAFPEEEFDEYADDDRVLQEMYGAALDELRTVRYIYKKNP